MKNIFISGYYGYGNVGDNMLVEVVVRQIKSFGFKSNITLTSRDDSLLPELDVETVYYDGNSSNKIKYFTNLVLFILANYKRNDIVIYGGGTQIYDNSKYSWKPLLVTAVVLVLNKLFYNRKVIHYGVGIGTVNTLMGKVFTRIIGKTSDFFVVRDDGSVNKLLNLKVSPNKILLARDLAYSLESETFTNHVTEEKSVTRYGLSLFQYYKYTEIDKTRELQFDYKVIETIEFLLSKTTNEVYIFIFQQVYGNQDNTYADAIKNRFATNRLKIVPYSNDWNDINTEMAKMDVCIGMRYHFILNALKLRKPVIALSYSTKIDNELKMFELSENLIPIDEISPQRIEKLLNSIAHGSAYEDYLDKKFIDIKQSVKKAEDKFKKLVCE